MVKPAPLMQNKAKAVMVMKDILQEVNSPLFNGINSENRKTILGCIGYHIGTFKKGDIVAFEEENIQPTSNGII